MTDEVVPHFHNDPGVPVIEIGAEHVYRCAMCPYCSTLYRHNPALAPNEARPAECELHHLG